MTSLKSRQHISTLAILEQQILEWKKSSVSRRPKAKPISIRPVKSAQEGVSIKRANSLNNDTAKSSLKKEKKTLKSLTSIRKVKERAGCKKLKKTKNQKSRKNASQNDSKSIESIDVTDRQQMFSKLGLLVQDSSKFSVKPSEFLSSKTPLTEPVKEQLHDWLPNHPTITKDMRREQVEFIMNLSGKFIYGNGLGIHAVCVLDNFMSKTPQRVVTADSFKLVSTAAFVVALNSRFGEQTEVIIEALAKVGCTEVQQIKRFTKFIQSTLGFDKLRASDALDFLSAHYNNQTAHNQTIDEVCVLSKRLLVEATRSYTAMNQTYPSRLATSAILVSCELLNENCCQLFSNLEIPTCFTGIKTINVMMNWFRQVHRMWSGIAVDGKY